MAFGHGKDCAVYADGYDLSSYLTKAVSKLSCDVAKTTTMGKSSNTYLSGVKDGKFTCDGLWEGSAGAADAVFSAALGAAETLVLVYPHGDDSQGDVGVGARTIQSTYDITSPVDNVVSTVCEFQCSNDVDRVQSLHPLAAETSGGNKAIWDGAASSSAGCACHLQITAFSGTNVIVQVQHGTEAGGGDMAELVTFTSVTAANASERKTTSGTVNRYLRISLSGTFTSATIAVAFSRK